MIAWKIVSIALQLRMCVNTIYFRRLSMSLYTHIHTHIEYLMQSQPEQRRTILHLHIVKSAENSIYMRLFRQN